MRLRGWALPFGAAAVVGLVVLACGSDDDDDVVVGSPDAGGDSLAPIGTGDGGVVISAPAPLDPTVAARAATVIASCFSDDGVNRTLQEFYLDRIADFSRSPAVVACLAATTKGCAAFDDCLGVTRSKDSCDAGCIGTASHSCSEGHVVQECSRVGYTCVPGRRRGQCALATAETCDPTTTQGTCSDGIPVGCAEGVVRRGFRCPDYGAECKLTSTLKADPDIENMGCVGTGGKCESTTTLGSEGMSFEGVKCDGEKLVACLGGGLATLDCASSATGFHCFEAPDGGPQARAYCGTAAECTPQSPWEKVKATCDGNSVVACNGGKIEKIDCVSLGFTSCSNGICAPTGF